MSERHEHISELVGEIAPEVWLRLSGNGSLQIAIDTDVQCYGLWDPHGGSLATERDRVREAQDWVEYFVRSTINRLVDMDLLNMPEES